MRVRPAKERWEGGYIRTGKKRRTFVIDRWVGGEHFHVSTRASDRAAALEQLRRFEVNPRAYTPAGDAGPPPFEMTAELVLEYRQWMTDSKGNTPEWASTSARMLAEWIEALGGRDFRKLSAVADIKPLLAKWKTSVPARVIALKGFMSWLRKEKGLVRHFEDPMPDVRIPKRPPQKAQLARAVDSERVLEVWKHLRPDMRDVLQLLAGTGWHVTEARRFAERGEIRDDPTGKHLAVLVTFHKRKEWAVTGLTKAEHLAAAKRIRARGFMLSQHQMWYLLKRTCERAGIERFNLGDMRHTVMTWSAATGQSLDEVARAVNHASDRMARERYVAFSVPRATMKTRALRLVK